MTEAQLFSILSEFCRNSAISEKIAPRYNSGTNLLTQLIKKNLPEAHPAAYPPDAVWKHAKLSALSPGLRRELRRHAAVAIKDTNEYNE